MSRPSATQLYAKMPRMIWFRIPVIVPFMFPQIPEYEVRDANSALCTYMIKKLKWGKVLRKKGTHYVFWCI